MTRKSNLKNKDKIKTFLDSQKLRESVARRPIPKEILAK